VKGVAVMIDNFAIPAATIRGLFDYDYRHDRLILRPRIPGTITRYEQKQAVRFGDKKLYLTCNNGGPDIEEVKVNGKSVEAGSGEELTLSYDALPMEAEIEITTTGGWPELPAEMDYPMVPMLVEEGSNEGPAETAELQESLKKPFAVLTEMKDLLEDEPGAEYEKAFVEVALQSCEASRERKVIDPGQGYFREITPERKEGIIDFYEQAALTMYKGFENLMEKYSKESDTEKKHIAELFSKAKNSK